MHLSLFRRDTNELCRHPPPGAKPFRQPCIKNLWPPKNPQSKRGKKARPRSAHWVLLDCLSRPLVVVLTPCCCTLSSDWTSLSLSRPYGLAFFSLWTKNVLTNGIGGTHSKKGRMLGLSATGASLLEEEILVAISALSPACGTQRVRP